MSGSHSHRNADLYSIKRVCLTLLLWSGGVVLGHASPDVDERWHNSVGHSICVYKRSHWWIVSDLIALVALFGAPWLAWWWL